MTTSSRKGRTRACSAPSLAQLNATCPPGTCWAYQNVAYDASSEMVSRVTGLPYEQAVKRYLFNPIGMTQRQRLARRARSRTAAGRRPHSAGERPLPIVDTYYKVPGAGGINSNIKDMALWMLAQMGEMPDVLDGRVLDTIHAPYVVTPTERGRLRKFLERLGTAWYGYGWRSYDYAGHRIVGHRGGINGYRSLILFDPAEEERRRRAVEQQHQPARRARVRGHGHDLPPAVPRLAGAQQAKAPRRSIAARRDEPENAAAGTGRKRRR